jgi:hypothetical protein
VELRGFSFVFIWSASVTRRWKEESLLILGILCVKSVADGGGVTRLIV